MIRSLDEQVPGPADAGSGMQLALLKPEDEFACGHEAAVILLTFMAEMFLMRPWGGASRFLLMKILTLLVAVLALLSGFAFAGGGNEDIYFKTSGWTLHLSDADGSSADLTRMEGSREIFARLRFSDFGGYWAAFQSMQPISAKSATGSKRQCYTVKSDGTGKEQRRYYDFAAAEGLMALLLFQHRGDIYTHEPDAFRQAFTESPPLPVIREWQLRADWSRTFVIHDRKKEPF